MAALRTRLDPSALDLKSDLAFTDIWADTSKPGVTAHASINVKYTGNANPADDLAHAGAEQRLHQLSAAHRADLDPHPRHRRRHHLHQLPHRSGQARPARRHLRHRPRRLLRGAAARRSGDRPGHRPAADPHRGRRADDRARCRPWWRTAPAAPMGMARSSRLAEILFGEALKASSDARTAHPNPPSTAPDHSTMLNAAERRLVTEWMDLGGQYVNNPSDGGVRAVVMLSQATFEAQVYPVLKANCASGCHQAGGTGPTPAVAPSFRGNRFVLTGKPGRRLQRDAVDDLRYLPRGQQLPAQPPVDRAASARRDDADDGSAAAGQRRTTPR